MDLSFSPRGRSLPARSPRLRRRGQTQAAEKSGCAGTGAALQGRLSGLAPAAFQKGLGGAGLAEGIGRLRLERDPALHFFHRNRARPSMPTTLPFGLGMVGPVIYTFGSEAQKSEIPAPHSLRRRLVVPGLFRTRRRIGSGQPALPRGEAKAIIISSTARRPGPPWRNMPTGSSAWCAPIRAPSRRKAFPSC